MVVVVDSLAVMVVHRWWWKWWISFSHVTPLVVRHFPPMLPHYFDSLAVGLVWPTRRQLVAAIVVRWSAAVGGSVYVVGVLVVVVYCSRGVVVALVKWRTPTMVACPYG